MSFVTTLEAERMCRRMGISKASLDWIIERGQEFVGLIRERTASPIEAIIALQYAMAAVLAASNVPEAVLRDVWDDNWRDLKDLALRVHEDWLRRKDFSGEVTPEGDVIKLNVEG